MLCIFLTPYATYEKAANRCCCSSEWVYITVIVYVSMWQISRRLWAVTQYPVITWPTSRCSLGLYTRQVRRTASRSYAEHGRWQRRGRWCHDDQLVLPWLGTICASRRLPCGRWVTASRRCDDRYRQQRKQPANVQLHRSQRYNCCRTEQVLLSCNFFYGLSTDEFYCRPVNGFSLQAFVKWLKHCCTVSATHEKN